MRMQHALFSAIAVIAVLGRPLLASADDQGGGPPPMPRPEVCKENPGKCDEARARRQEFCKANPQKCEEQREQMKARRAELEAQCKADPAGCDEMKAEARKKRQDRMGEPPPQAN